MTSQWVVVNFAVKGFILCFFPDCEKSKIKIFSNSFKVKILTHIILSFGDILCNLNYGTFTTPTNFGPPMNTARV